MTDFAQEIDTVLAEAQAALVPIKMLITMVAPFLPQAERDALNTAVRVIDAMSTTAPDFVKNAKAITADIEAIIAAIRPAA